MYGTLISTQTLASTALTVTFSSIPQTYTDLVLTCSLRDGSAGTEGSFALVFNSDTGANYSGRELQGTGSAASSITNSGATYLLVDFGTPGNGATANTFGNSIITISNYTGSTAKAVSIDAVSENNAAAAKLGLNAGIWTGTAAITSVMVRGVSSNFAIGSTISLYGLTHF